MNIINKPIEEIIPYTNNPRKNKEAVDKVAASIKEFGFQQPIVVDKDNVIIVGHTRLLAARKLKLKTVPVKVAEDLTEEQARAYRLADNKTNEFSLWDDDLLLPELDSIEDIDMSLFGFDINLDDIGEEPEEDDIEDVEKLETHYGVPYQGNKSRIADKIISVLPEGKRLVDLFGGVEQLPIVLCSLISGNPFYTMI